MEHLKRIPIVVTDSGEGWEEIVKGGTEIWFITPAQLDNLMDGNMPSSMYGECVEDGSDVPAVFYLSGIIKKTGD